MLLDKEIVMDPLFMIGEYIVVSMLVYAIYYPTNVDIFIISFAYKLGIYDCFSPLMMNTNGVSFEHELSLHTSKITFFMD